MSARAQVLGLLSYSGARFEWLFSLLDTLPERRKKITIVAARARYTDKHPSRNVNGWEFESEEMHFRVRGRFAWL
jgi:hypothetical protein